MVYGYARVSTAGQAKDGNSLAAQEQQLRDHGAEKIYTDVTTGAKTKNRPQLDSLLKNLTQGDILVVAKLDRIARSIIDGSRLVDGLLGRGITINILNIGIMDSTPTSKLIRSIFFSFAEFERDMIRERTQEGKAVAKTKNGYKEGRPKKFTNEQIRHAVELLENRSYREVQEMMKISKSTLQRAKRGRIHEELDY